MLRGPALLAALRALPFSERDAWLDARLGFAELPPDDPELPRGAVPYLPSGVDEIVTLVEEAPVGAHDELVDIGSGLGRVVIAAHLFTGARARGIEIQASLVEGARRRAAALGLDGVSFVHANAAEVELDGSVFYLYAPCNGEMLTRVLARLEAVARRRSIVIGAVGLELDRPWLRARKSSCASLSLYDSERP